jgi:hypothetical protein
MKAEKRRQAEVVFRRLLVARELVAPARSTDERTPVDVSPQRARRVAEVNATAARAASTGGSSPPLLAPLLMGAVSVAVFAALVLLVRLGRRVRAPSGG